MSKELQIKEHVDPNSKILKRWTYQANGKPKAFEEYSADGVLTLSRTYDDSGNELETRVFSAAGVLIHRALYKGGYTKRFKWSASGTLTEEAEYLNNYRHGVVSLYSEKTGRLLSRIEYQDDRFHGLKEVYYDSSDRHTLRERASYKNGQVEGEFAEYYANGRLKETGEIREGKREGEYKKYYENGRLKSIWRFREGELHGLLEEFNEAGSLVRRSPMKEGKQHGIEEYFSPEGKLTSRSAHINGSSTNDFSQFELDSDSASGQPKVVELFYSSGSLRLRETFEKGIRNGPFEEFHSNGKVKSRGTYLDDKYNGQISWFGSEGELRQSVCYKLGVKDGPTVSYFSSGEISSVLTYSAGEVIGSRQYYENGKLKNSVDLEAGEIGVWRQYSDRGVLLRESQISSSSGHLRPSRHGKDLIYNESGQLEMESQMQFGRPHGTTRHYWPEGGIQFEYEYVEGHLISLTEFTRGGQVRRQASFMSDGSIKSEQIFETNEQEIPSSIWEPGASIDGYKIVRALGHGGMGDVYLADEIGLERRVAIKTIRGNATESALGRFIAEGRALAKVKHPNVVAIYSVGQTAGTPYMVMEYVEGWALHALIGHGMLSLGEQLAIFRQMILGVHAAHNAKVLHRDLKPTNVIISRDLAVKIIDFGIAKLMDDSQVYQTETGVVVGTVRYLAPEIAKGMPPSIQTDIYGLGIVFFEMLTGDLPFKGENKLEILEKIKTAPLEFPEGISDILPDALKILVAKMMAKSVEDRHINLGEVLREFDSIKFDHLPAELMSSTPKGIEIGNLDEVRRLLKERGYSESEFSLILNLASRIQIRMLVDPDATAPIGKSEELIISPTALNEATERFQRAKRDVQNSRSRQT